MLSSRGREYLNIGYLHGKLDEYHETKNPNGIVYYLNAENTYIHGDLIDFINSKKFDKSCCAYGEGYTGNDRLRTAMAIHLNEFFKPRITLDAEHLTFVAGVTELNEICASLLCDENCGDAIMIGRPDYGSFNRDMVSRGHIGLVFADSNLDERFTSGDIKAYTDAFENAKQRGTNVKALLISNPNNPLGRCYSPKALVALVQFCQARGIHLISDEIYALSTYNRADRPSETFTSVLAVDAGSEVDMNLIHVSYGMSKDYGAAGLRLGCLITHSRDFSHAARGLCRFSSPSQFSMSIATDMLEDRVFIKDFLKKAQAALLEHRVMAEATLDAVGISYYRQGNSAHSMWLDLREYLPLDATKGDPLAAEAVLCEKLRENKVVVSPGTRYFASEPGHYRILHCIEESALCEGIRRIHQVCQKQSLRGEHKA